MTNDTTVARPENFDEHLLIVENGGERQPPMTYDTRYRKFQRSGTATKGIYYCVGQGSRSLLQQMAIFSAPYATF